MIFMSKSIKIGISKYKNDNGVSCYLNSILHIMQQLPIFSDYLISGEYLNDLPDIKNITDSDYLNNLVIYELAKLFKLSYENDNSTIIPKSFKKLIGTKNDLWSELEQQDSQEFLIFIISQLEEELARKVEFIPGRVEFTCESISSPTVGMSNFLKPSNKSKSKKLDVAKINSTKINGTKINGTKINGTKINGKRKITGQNIYNICSQSYKSNDFSIMKELFTGSQSSKIICEKCNSFSPNFDNFITLSVDIPKTNNDSKKFSLMECLKHSLKDEKFDNDNKVNCDFCGIKNCSTKQIKLWKTPKILIIHFKRFKVNEYGQQVKKITNQINYPITDLNLQDLFDENSPFKIKSKYNLVGINLHHELMKKSIDVGHYVSYVKNRYDNEWYCFNDSSEPVKLNTNQLQTNNAYMLFYLEQCAF